MKMLAGFIVLMCAGRAAEITAIRGKVLVRHDGQAEASAAAVKQVFVNGDELITPGKGRAEVRLDPMNDFQAAKTRVRFEQPGEGVYRLELIEGSITWQVNGPSAADIEIRTPSVTVRPADAGEFVIALKSSGETEITARAGAIEVLAPQGSQWVAAGQKMVARGLATNPEFKIGSAVSRWWRTMMIIANCMQVTSDVMGAFTSGSPGEASFRGAGGSRAGNSHTPASPRVATSTHAPPPNRADPKSK